MLRVETLTRSQFHYYLDLTSSDPATVGGEQPGYWLGRAPERLGIDPASPVSLADLDEILSAKRGRSRGDARRAAGDRSGWDVALSAPKDVSTLWALGDDRLRAGILAAHRQAVAAALQFFQSDLAFIRIGEGGQRHLAADIAAAAFEHHTSRELDPQLHTHLLVLNIGVTPDGKRVGALHSTLLYKSMQLLDAAYLAELAAGLELDLGLAIAPAKHGFQIVGVPGELSKRFSKRREQVKKQVAANPSQAGPGNRYAARKTRPARRPVPPESELFAAWAQEAGELRCQPVTPAHDAPVRAFAKMYRQALEKLTGEQSHFSSFQLLRAVFERAPSSGLRLDQVMVRLDAAMVRRHGLVCIDPAKRLYTTPGMLETERQLQSDVARLSFTESVPVNRRRLDRVIEKLSAPRSEVAETVKHHLTQVARAAMNKPTSKLDRQRLRQDANWTLNEEQAAALRHLCDIGGSVRVLEGFAGTSKTRLLRVAAELWRRDGRNVIGVALAGRMAQHLQKVTGVPSTSLAKLQHRLEPPTVAKAVVHHAKQVFRELVGLDTTPLHKPTKLPPGTIIVVDEAGMIGTRQMAWLTRTAVEHGAELRLIGDRTQLPEIEAGGAFAWIADNVGKATLTQNFRQRQAADRRVVENLSLGSVTSAIADLNQRGRIVVAKDREAATARLLDDWAKHDLFEPQRAAILTDTHERAETFNSLCRQRRVDVGVVKEKGALVVEGERIGVGDRVLFTQGDAELGVENGQTGTVIATRKGFVRGTLSVRMDHADDGHGVTHVPLAGYSAVRLAYAMPTHLAQGQTFERVYLPVEPGTMYREMLTTQVSRAIDRATLYLDEASAGVNLSELVKSASQSRRKQLAHEVAEPAALSQGDR